MSLGSSSREVRIYRYHCVLSILAGESSPKKKLERALLKGLDELTGVVNREGPIAAGV